MKFNTKNLAAGIVFALISLIFIVKLIKGNASSFNISAIIIFSFVAICFLRRMKD